MVAERGDAPFHIGARSADPTTGVIALEYYFEGDSPFLEEIHLELSDPAERGSADVQSFDAAARILHLLAGTSYFKSQAPSTLVVDDADGITPAEAELMRATYDEGLREFAVQNGLEIPLITTLSYQMRPPASAAFVPSDELRAIGRPLIPFGGGKDSTLVQHLLPEAVPVTVNPVSTHHLVAAELGHELRVIRRRLSKVTELTRPDRLNGHIPITAIVSAVAVAFAALEGFTSVVMANERSASEPTLWTDDGKPVNHQYSKSAAFEERFRAALGQAGVRVEYFSLLRNLNEAAVAKALSPLTGALKVMLSCNNAFTGSGTGAGEESEQRWCGHCPKCLFSFLMLAPHQDPSTMHTIFGKDLLNDSALVPGFQELWNPHAKPWECVGERSEAAGALLTVAAMPVWKDHSVVRQLVPSARAALETIPKTGTADTGSTRIPPAFEARVPVGP